MRTDFIVVGAGIAGASAAFELAKTNSVTLLEREERPGYHTTGRSAAMIMGGYGEPEFRALTQLSEDFLCHPFPGFTETPLLKARGCVYVGAEDEKTLVEEALAGMRDAGCTVSQVDADWIARRIPIARRESMASGIWEEGAREIDVHALHEGFLRGYRNLRGTLVTDCGECHFDRSGGLWSTRVREDVFEAPVVINAAGAWADAVGTQMGGRPKGIMPLRRTAVLVDPPLNVDVAAWPLVIHVAEDYYFKPDAGKILISPADETPTQPCDAQPEELDVAIGIDRFERVTTCSVKRITHRWAGLRSFAPDRRPVVGFDPDVDGLFWLAGQGGSGIMTSPALARLTAELGRGRSWPFEFSDAGVTAASLSPARFDANVTRIG